VNVKLVPATRADCIGFVAPALHAGAEGSPELSVICCTKISELAVTFVEFTV